MRIVRIALAVLLGAAVAGCAPGWGLVPFNHGPRTDAREQLRFLDRLSAASADDLTAIGRDLRTRLDVNGDVVTRMRYALWLSVPGHPGHDAEAARHRFEALLANSADTLDDGSRALARIRLREIRREERRAREQARQHDDLVRQNRELVRQNQELRRKIRALTTLEQEMGNPNDQPENP